MVGPFHERGRRLLPFTVICYHDLPAPTAFGFVLTIIAVLCLPRSAVAWDEVETWAQGPSVAFPGYSVRLTCGSEVWWDIVLSTDHPGFKGCDRGVVADFQ